MGGEVSEEFAVFCQVVEPVERASGALMGEDFFLFPGEGVGDGGFFVHPAVAVLCELVEVVDPLVGLFTGCDAGELECELVDDGALGCAAGDIASCVALDVYETALDRVCGQHEVIAV
ncbi:hypothetical protein CCHOA_01390 [Corynebacterium choanae]|uniref:Uncharacterized protein n=1 Tax=Corynebacterium choanae TaxID=1862358 RepID=A0A3G6J437_9CORY|nr:hypothetical protein CCHOA_01390 [Corynebacterium choanae]